MNAKMQRRVGHGGGGKWPVESKVCICVCGVFSARGCTRDPDA